MLQRQLFRRFQQLKSFVMFTIIITSHQMSPLLAGMACQHAMCMQPPPPLPPQVPTPTVKVQRRQAEKVKVLLPSLKRKEGVQPEGNMV